MKFARFPLIVLLAVRAIPAADVALTDLFPAGTKVVFGLNVRSLTESPLAQAGLAQAKTQMQSQAGAADWLKMAALVGFDPLRDIDEVLVATNGEGQNPPSLIVASGRFNVERLGSGAKLYHDVPILGGDKPTDGVVALLSGTIALAGDRPTVLAAIDHLGSGPQIDGAMTIHIDAARARYDIWGMGDRPEGFVAPTPQASALETIDRFQFGISVTHGLEMGAEVHARTAKDAEQLMAMVGMLQGAIKAQQPAANGAKFDVSSDNGTIKLSLAVSEAEVLKAVKKQTGGAPTTMAARPAPRTVPIISMSPASGTPAAPDAVQARVPGKPVAPGIVSDKEGNTVVLTLPGKK